MIGYDIPLISEISKNISIPVVALGGAGTLNHMEQAFHNAHVSALAAGSMFVYQGTQKGVLINYPERKELVDFRLK
jgi:cyclase